MDEFAILTAVVSGANALILGGVALNNYRIGKLEGIIKNGNGGYIKCPFYKGHVEAEVKKRKRGS